MKKRKWKKQLCAALTVCMVCSSSGCGRKTEKVDTEPTQTMMEAADIAVSEEGESRDREPEKKRPVFEEKDALVFTDFAMRLLSENLENDKNTLLSPLSVLYALGMTANGAKGETRAQMEEVLGMSVEELNESLAAYTKDLPEGDKYQLNSANSIWIRDMADLSVNQDFLQANTDWYGADIYRAPFDESTVKEINDWVSDKTKKRIPDIVDQIPQDSMMYLVNALAFDAEWKNIYTENAASESVFFTEDGKEETVAMLNSTEHYWLEDTDTTGFVKPYADDSYAFVALLPKEGVSVSEYAASLTGEKLQEMLSGMKEEEVITALPRFESEYAAELGESLQKMGMTDAFDFDRADFSGIGATGRGNLAISRVLHKTYIAVDEKGTKAGDVTAVEMSGRGMMEPPKQVILNRPFVYLLIDLENRVPVFAGVMRNPQL